MDIYLIILTGGVFILLLSYVWVYNEIRKIKNLNDVRDNLITTIAMTQIKDGISLLERKINKNKKNATK